jgi:predicted transcriptional regulator
MARFGDLEAAIMDVMWAGGTPVRVREVADELNQNRPLAFNTVQTVMENLFRKGWLDRRKDGRAYWYVTVRSREDYVAGLMGEALAVARDPAATLVRLVEDLEPGEIAQLRLALDAAAGRESPR